MAPLLDMSLVPEWTGTLVDRTDHAPGAQHRQPHEAGCSALVLHRIGDPAVPPPPEALAGLPPDEGLGDEGHDVEGIIRFFTQNPEGVATVTLDGTYDSKRATIAKWAATGVPESVAAHAFVPYTFLIAPDGTVSQMLPLGAAGAHARGFNQSGYGIALLGDFRFESPPVEQLEAAVAVCVALLRQLGLSARRVKLLGHDEARAAMGQGPKQCPGALFPLAEVRARVLDAAG